MCAYTVAYACLFVYEQVYFDPGLVLYLYDSIAGFGLVILRLIGWCSFIYSTFFTLKHYPDKGGFYCPFFCFYTLWFICGPTLIIVANTNIELWVREKVRIFINDAISATNIPSYLFQLGCGFCGTFCCCHRSSVLPDVDQAEQSQQELSLPRQNNPNWDNGSYDWEHKLRK